MCLLSVSFAILITAHMIYICSSTLRCIFILQIIIFHHTHSHPHRPYYSVYHYLHIIISHLISLLPLPFFLLIYFSVYYFLQSGYTPLHLACGKGHESTVLVLLENKADPNLQNKVTSRMMMLLMMMYVCMYVCMHAFVDMSMYVFITNFYRHIDYSI